MRVKSAAIAIDDYKLQTFEDALKRATFSWERCKGLTSGTVILKVEYSDVDFDKLQKVIAAANEVAVAS